jgi:hypothetical protein
MQRLPDVPWTGKIIDGRLYSHDGARAYEHVKAGADPEQLQTLMGGGRGWLLVHHHYARHLAEGPLPLLPQA